MPVDIQKVRDSKIFHSPQVNKKYLFVGIFILIVFLAFFPFIKDIHLQGSYVLNAFVKTIGSLFAIISGTALLAWFSRTGFRIHLFVGLAFFINGLIEFIHGFFTFVSLLPQNWLSAVTVFEIVHASQIISELFLISLLFLSLFASKFFPKAKYPKTETLLFTILIMIAALLVIILFYTFKFSQTVNYNHFFSHPINLLYAVTLFLISILFFSYYMKNKEMLKWWFFLSVAIISISQLYIACSRLKFDALFEFGLFLKLAAYLVLLVGVFIYILIRIRQMSIAEIRLINQKEVLQETVTLQTIELRDKNKQLLNEIKSKDNLFQSLLKKKEELAASEEHFRDFFENSVIGMYQTNISGDILSANKSLCRLLGYNSFDELKKHNTNINKFIENKEREKFINIIEKNGFITGLETEWIAGNKKIYIRESAKRKKDRKWGIIYEGIVEDITKQKIAEKQKTIELKSIVESANIPIFGINKQKEITIWNKTMQELTGYQKNEVFGKEIGHNNIRDIFINNSPEIFNNVLDGMELTDFEFNIRSKQKKLLKFLISITPLHDLDENISGAVFIARNITQIDIDKKTLEKLVEERTKDLKEALEKQKELVRLKSRFVDMTSHEFRTPLTAIRFAAAYVLKYWDRLDSKAREQKLLKIENQVNHMIFLLEGVLTLGKTEAGKVKINKQLFNLTDFFDPLIEEVTMVESNNHKIEYLNDTTACKIYIDENIGRNIFINLLTNAIKFSPDSNLIHIGCSCRDNQTIIEIIDYGIGIRKEEIEHIFTPFHRAENADTIQGTGLGLAIVKDSVIQQDGTIKVTSTVGKGTCFTISLPLPDNM